VVASKYCSGSNGIAISAVLCIKLALKAERGTDSLADSVSSQEQVDMVVPTSSSTLAPHWRMLMALQPAVACHVPPPHHDDVDVMMSDGDG
jgi:hypothetical protein